MNRTFENSETLHHRALKTIPLGTQTFSKSKTQYPFGVSPYFAKRAKGARLWDVDGHEYVDLNCALCSVTLGYGDEGVKGAVAEQLESGVSFTLAHELEVEVAERLVDMVPCAEQVRFGKNGSDATTGAVRLARAFTGRDLVAVCGYHGWQDWYIGSTSRNAGIPKPVQELTHPFLYNDLDSLRDTLSKGQFAAVILEPMNRVWPNEGFLQGVKDLAHEHGALLIFDEMITGFRFARGGAQELFGVTPDLASFGKGVANGFPLSAIVGRKDVMALMEEIFFSFTFGGEAMSLAATKAVLDRLSKEDVPKALATRGEQLNGELTNLIEKHGIADRVKLEGHPSWTFVTLGDWGEDPNVVKTFFLQEMFQSGILTLGTHNLCAAFGDAEQSQVLEAYDRVFGLMKEGNLASKVRGEVLKPLFKVR